MSPEPRILRLNYLQSGICKHPARFKVVVCGRRFGKTWTGRTWLTEKADQRRRLWYVAPTYTIAHDIIWREFMETIPDDWYAKKPNQTRLEIELKTGALIQLKGADNPDSLRGRGVHRMVIDEYADMPDAWDEIFRPALADTQGEAMFLGTPKGYDHFYQLWKRGQDAAFPDWMSWRYPTRMAPHFLTPGGMLELAAIKAETQPHLYRQEYEAEFEARAGMIVGPVWEPSHTITGADTALLARGLTLGQRIPWHVLDDPRWVPSPSSNVYGSVDYGFGAPTAIYLHALGTDNHIRTFWEWWKTRVVDRDQAIALRDGILKLEEDHGVQRPQWIAADPSMFNARTEQGMKSIAEIYEEVLSPLGVWLLKGAAGRPARLSRPNRWLDACSVSPDGTPYWSCTTACPQLIRSLPEVPWDPDDIEVEDDESDNHAYESIGRLLEARPVVPKTKPIDSYQHLDPLSRAEAERQEAKWVPTLVPRGGITGFGSGR